MIRDRLPAAFLERLTQILPPESLPACLGSFSQAKRPAFRVNTLIATVAAALRELEDAGIHPSPVAWMPEAFTIPVAQRPALVDSAAAAAGRIYLQNLSSMLPALLLAPAPGQAVLDLAAAPGGKTLHLAALMHNQGSLSAVEVVRSRMYKLKDNLRRGGASMVRTYLTDGRSVGRKTPARFDRVLLDAPCSAEARFRADEPRTWAYWSPRKIREQARKQKGLLNSGLQALKPGGELLYGTCSFAPEENELVVQDQLERWGDQVEIRRLELPVPNVQPGLRAWDGRELALSLQHCCRVLPDEYMLGFFLCKLQKLA